MLLAIVDLGHRLAKLARSVAWGICQERFGAVYSDGPGAPSLPTRLMTGLDIFNRDHPSAGYQRAAERVN